MRTLNIKTNSSLLAIPTSKPPISVDDKQPCWYADMENASKRKDYKWKVGCKHEGKTDEYSFKISKAGDVNNDKFWKRATGVDFAIELIDLFKHGGAKAIKDWIKNGCP